MNPVEGICVAGFRGILSEFDISLVKGSTARSVILYGGNGTGKSSLTDALEWFQTGNIERLRREDAGPRSYPNRAVDFDPYVRLRLRDPALGTAGLVYSRSRITAPEAEGALEEVRAAAPSPWQIRNEDLSRFVVMTKAQRFDALASLMGFQPQVEFLKGLRRTAGAFARKRSQQQAVLDAEQNQLMASLDSHDTSAAGCVAGINEALGNLAPPIVEIGEASAVRDRLASDIEADPRAAELAELRALRTNVCGPFEVGDIVDAAAELAEALRALRSELGSGADLSRLQLLEVALQHLGASEWESGNECPLCDAVYEGDLTEHVRDELDRLDRLRSLQRLVRTRQTASRATLDDLLDRIASDLSMGDNGEQLGVGDAFQILARALTDLGALLERARDLAGIRADEWAEEQERELATLVENVGAMTAEATAFRNDLSNVIETQEAALDNRGTRGLKVRARDFVRDVLDNYERAARADQRLSRISDVCREFDRIVDEYALTSIADVETRFNLISADVDRYFGTLEENTPGLARPALRLLPGQDRAVVLEIEFRGERIDQAFGFLSQSQLNSFGLAVFLASARVGNTGFPFLVLDDVINSFDAYKRPRLAQLLRTEFSDFQLFVLTHDQVWWDRIARECPDWVRLRFARFEPGSGPVCQEGLSSIDEIDSFILDDRPELAGRSLGPLMELELQEFAEAFGALVPYNRRNEYTLEPLLDRVRVRVSDKLGNAHPLHTTLREMHEATSFRNFAAHWKDPESPITAEEMRGVFVKWAAVTALARCTLPGCGSVLAYERSSGSFVCSICRGTTLTRA